MPDPERALRIGGGVTGIGDETSRFLRLTESTSPVTLNSMPQVIVSGVCLHRISHAKMETEKYVF